MHYTQHTVCMMIGMTIYAKLLLLYGVGAVRVRLHCLFMSGWSVIHSMHKWALAVGTTVVVEPQHTSQNEVTEALSKTENACQSCNQARVDRCSSSCGDSCHSCSDPCVYCCHPRLDALADSSKRLGNTFQFDARHGAGLKIISLSGNVQRVCTQRGVCTAAAVQQSCLA